MKNKLIIFSIIATVFFLSLIRCEKDDICIEGTEGTPSLIIRFFDFNNITEPKTVPFLVINKLDDADIVILSRYVEGSKDERNKFRVTVSYF